MNPLTPRFSYLTLWLAQVHKDFPDISFEDALEHAERDLEAIKTHLKGLDTPGFDKTVDRVFEHVSQLTKD